MTQWLVLGAGGMLGSDIRRQLDDRDSVALNRADLDITNHAATAETIRRYRPDTVVNCAAWTAVDAAEDHEADAFNVNAVGAANVATACRDVGARLVHISTDYVFDGTATTPYPESAPLHPASAYGRSKAAGEWAVRSALPDSSWIVRTAWLYGVAGPNFVQTMIRAAGQRDTVDVVDDQRGQPTWTAEVARQIVNMVYANAQPGVYRATCSNSATWFELAQAVFQLLGADPERVRPTTSDRLLRPAPRPAYSVLGHDAWCAAGLAPLPHWRASLDQASCISAWVQ
ncbi:MAG TPA: dTDP-4-dehydrorhamnose reductase [Jiangellaceae bacterium]